MGSGSSKEKKKGSLPNGDIEIGVYDSRVSKAFKSLANGQSFLTISNFTNTFGEDFGSDLWKYLSKGGNEKMEMGIDQFSSLVLSLMGSSTDIYTKILAPASHCLQICAESAGINPFQGGHRFFDIIAKQMESAENDVNEWKRQNCPRLCNAVQTRVLSAFGLEAPQKRNYKCDLLTPFEMWFVMSALPSVYFTVTSYDGAMVQDEWKHLYTSNEHGISVSRFEAKVFDYRGPTVTIMRLIDDTLLVLGMEQEWRNSGTKFTTSSTVIFKLQPNFVRIDKASVYCNLKLRNYPMKILLDRDIKISKDLDEVISLEVFGCGNGFVFEEQQKQKTRQKKQVEKNQKVPLPGKWEDNPDKFLLELSGVYSTENRREVFNRENEAGPS